MLSDIEYPFNVFPTEQNKLMNASYSLTTQLASDVATLKRCMEQKAKAIAIDDFDTVFTSPKMHAKASMHLIKLDGHEHRHWLCTKNSKRRKRRSMVLDNKVGECNARMQLTQGNL